MDEREQLIQELKEARRAISKAAYEARKAGFQVTLKDVVGNDPKYAEMTLEALREDLKFYKSLKTKQGLIDYISSFTNAYDYETGEMFKTAMPGWSQIIIKNFESTFMYEETGKSTLASWLVEKWYSKTKELYTEDEIAEALENAKKKGYDYEDYTYGSGDEAAYETNTFINVLMQELRDIESRAKSPEDLASFNELFNDYQERWEYELGTHIETGRR